jgi:putative transposase
MKKNSLRQQETWLVELTMIGYPDMLTRPKYSNVIGYYLNYPEGRRQIDVDDYVIMPSRLIILVTKRDVALERWLQEYSRVTALNIRRRLEKDTVPALRTYMGAALLFFSAQQEILRNEACWHDVSYREITTEAEFEEALQYIYSAPVKAGLVTDVAHYAGSSVNNRAGIDLKEVYGDGEEEEEGWWGVNEDDDDE